MADATDLTRMDLGPGPRASELLATLRTFMAEHVYPAEKVYATELAAAARENGGVSHVLPPVVEELKATARSWGCGTSSCLTLSGLTNLEYAYARRGAPAARPTSPRRRSTAPAPDTGNMELLHMFGTPEQKQQWLEPLLDGDDPLRLLDDRAGRGLLRRPQHRHLDRARRRRVRHQRAQVVDDRRRPTRAARSSSLMGKTDPEAAVHRQQSMILVPVDTPGVTIVRSLPIFGYHDQHGHGEIRFADVRVPADEPARRRGRRLRDRPGPPRPGPHPPLHALHRHGRAGASS